MFKHSNMILVFFLFLNEGVGRESYFVEDIFTLVDKQHKLYEINWLNNQYEQHILISMFRTKQNYIYRASSKSQ